MSVIPITVFFSLGLVFFFVALFLREHRRRHFASAERDSLLPLADEQPRVVENDRQVKRGLPPSPRLWPTSRTRSEPVQRPGSTHAGYHSRCGREREVRPPGSDGLRPAATRPIH